jgi:hypothetical protein
MPYLGAPALARREVHDYVLVDEVIARQRMTTAVRARMRAEKGSYLGIGG